MWSMTRSTRNICRVILLLGWSISHWRWVSCSDCNMCDCSLLNQSGRISQSTRSLILVQRFHAIPLNCGSELTTLGSKTLTSHRRKFYNFAHLNKWRVSFNWHEVFVYMHICSISTSINDRLIKLVENVSNIITHVMLSKMKQLVWDARW